MRTLAAAAVSGAALVAAQRPVDQIEHVIIFMQENRAFDHYYGTLTGVRGFNDRAVHPLKNGLPAFYQPTDAKNFSDYQLPFPVNITTEAAICMPAPTMEYFHDIAIFDGGRLDAWNTARDMGLGPAYFTRYDLPYYYALLDGFTVADQYFQSTFTCTNPNRMHLFTGTTGLSVNKSSPVVDNTEPSGGYDWMTLGEVLQDAGVSWMVLQETDNFDDNANAWFAQYKKAKPGNPLHDRGMAYVNDIVDSLGWMLGNGTLPQVTIIVGPEELSEHATWHPSAGEDLHARLLRQLQAHPDVYKNTAWIANYDEGGQFNDYHLPFTPPMGGPSGGVSTVTTFGEVWNVAGIDLPIGPGFRVPMFIVSPWTRGHAVVSEVFDHTSVIKFLEVRFNVTMPTLSPWRRAMTGNLLSAFNFSAPDYSWPSDLPDTSGYVNQSNWQCNNLPPVKIPAAQSYPAQEAGTRISRALPYEFLVSDAVSAGAGAASLTLNITNTGAAGAPFNLLDVANLADVTPRKYAVTPGASAVDPLPINLTGTTAAGVAPASAPAATAPGQYFFALHGPNGFVRTFIGDVTALGGLGTTLSAAVTYDVPGDAVVVNMANGAAAGNGNTVEFTVTDNAYSVPGGPTWTFTLPGGGVAGSTATLSVPTGAVGGWYDLTITASLPGGGSGGPTLFSRRAMGRMETGRDTISDPAMAAGTPGYVPVPHSFASEAAWHAAMDAAFPVGATGSRQSRAALAWDAATGSIVHPPTPEHLRTVPRAGADAAATHKDAKWRWDADAVRAGEL